MLKIRKTPRKKKVQRKAKKPKFSRGQKVNILVGEYRGKTGIVTRTTPHFAIVQVNKRGVVKKPSSRNPTGIAQKQVFRQTFIRVRLGNVQAMVKSSKAKHARRRPRIDLVSKKLTRLTQLRILFSKLSKAKPSEVKKILKKSNLKTSGFKGQWQVEAEIVKLQKELKNKGPKRTPPVSSF